MIGLNISTTDKPVIVVDYEKNPDHDGFFKTIFTYKNGKYLKILIQMALSNPQVQCLDFSTLRFENVELLNSKGQKLRADLVVSMQVKGSQRRAAVALLIEHKSNSDTNMFIQVLEYEAALMRRGLLPACAIMVFNNLKSKQGPITLQQALAKKHPILNESKFCKAFGSYIPNFTCKVVGLGQLADKIRPSLKKDASLTLKVISHTMGCTRAKAKKQRLEAVHRLFELGEALSNEDYEFLISEALGYLSAHNFDIEIKEVRRMRSTRAQSREKKALSYWDIYGLKLAAKGREEGREEGQKKGHEAATQQLILNLLRGMAPKEVASHSGLSLKKVLAIKKQNGHTKV